MKKARRAAPALPAVAATQAVAATAVAVTLAAAALFCLTATSAEAQGLRGRRGLPSSLGNGSSSSSSSGQAGGAGKLSGRTSGSLTFGSPSFVTLPPQAPRATRMGTKIPTLPAPAPEPTITRPALPRRLPDWQRHHGTVVRPGDTIDWAGGSAVFIRPGRVIQLRDYGITLFQGYSPTCGPGYGYVSPFALYNCPPYIGASSVLIGTPYAYAGGFEQGTYAGWRSDSRSIGGAATDDYRDRSLRAALNDLSRFWEENDVRALRRRVSPSLAVAVFGGERHLYSLREADFLTLAADALDRVRTITLRFDDVRARNDGLVNAYAVHVYRLRGEDSTVNPRVATLRYTLVYVDGDWYVSAVSLAPEIAS